VSVLALRGLPGTPTVTERVLDTLAGGALAMIGYLALPTWERKRTRVLLAEMIDAQTRLAHAILAGYGTYTAQTAAAIERERTIVWKLRTAAEASIERSRREPHRTHTIAVGRALRIFGTMQRFGLANLALETALKSSRTLQRSLDLEAFARALDATMHDLAQALRTSSRIAVGTRVTDEVARVAGQLGASPNPELRYVADGLQEYADTVASLARLVGKAKAGQDEPHPKRNVFHE
jgi:hypothetical protein